MILFRFDFRFLEFSLSYYFRFKLAYHSLFYIDFNWQCTSGFCNVLWYVSWFFIFWTNWIWSVLVKSKSVWRLVFIRFLGSLIHISTYKGSSKTKGCMGRTTDRLCRLKILWVFFLHFKAMFLLFLKNIVAKTAVWVIKPWRWILLK